MAPAGFDIRCKIQVSLSFMRPQPDTLILYVQTLQKLHTLTALSPRVEPATVDGIVERFSGDGEGKEGKKGKGREGIDWLQGDFLK